MKVTYARSFLKDLRRLRDPRTVRQVRDILLNIEAASDFREIKNVKKLTGAESAYRIRVRNYRIGLKLIGERSVVVVRILHRKEIYRYFP